MAESDHAAQAAQVALGTEFTETFDVASKVHPDLKGPITIALSDQGDLIKMGIIQSRLREGVPLEDLDGLTQVNVLMLSTLLVVVRKAPDWWYEIEREPQKDGSEKEISRRPAPERIKDPDLLWEIHGRYANFRKSFPRSGGDENHRGAPA